MNLLKDNKKREKNVFFGKIFVKNTKNIFDILLKRSTLLGKGIKIALTVKENSLISI